MGIRPNSCYKRIKRSYTRSAKTVQSKDFLGGIPGVKTRQFVMGDQTKDYPWVIDMKCNENIQIRDNAIEAIRQKITRELTNKVGKDTWVVKIRHYPFHILRENKAAQGAGADRVSSGMKHSFGKNIGRAMQMHKGDILISVLVDAPFIDIAKKILDKSKYKLNMDYVLIVSKHENKRLSGRKKWTRETKVAKAEENTVTTPAETKDTRKTGKAMPASKSTKSDAKAVAPVKGGKGAQTPVTTPAKDTSKSGKKK